MDVLDTLASQDVGGRGIEAADDAADLLCALLTASVVRMVTARQEAGARAMAGATGLSRPVY